MTLNDFAGWAGYGLALTGIAVAGLFGLDGLDQLPATVGDRSRPWDWALLVLLGAGGCINPSPSARRRRGGKSRIGSWSQATARPGPARR